MSGHLPPFPVSREDIAESIAASISKKERASSVDMSYSPKRLPRGSNPATAPGSARGTPPPAGKPPLGSSGLLHVNCSSLSPSRASSRRGSITGHDSDSRRSSVNRLACDAVKDLRKHAKSVTDTTKKATHKVKDKTAGMGAHMMVATVGASNWVAKHTSKTAKAAMDQARSGLSGGEKFTLWAFEKITVLSRRGFTHLFMFLILLGYTALGAMLFIACEAPHEEKEKLAISEERVLLIEELWGIRSKNLSSFVQDAKVKLQPYEDQLFRSFSYGVSSDTEDRVWTFWKAMFFCATITTTIGYGHIAPKTTAGRALTIVYALIGIPIFLILMADFGKLFTRLLKNLFLFIRRVYRSGTCVKAREHPRVQDISQKATGRFETLKNFFLCRKSPSADAEEGVEGNVTVNPMDKDSEGRGGFVVGSMGSAGLERTVEEEEKYFTDGNFNLPISLALLILIVYMIIGCIIYIGWEDWSFFEAFYFIFVSMTTIGFGDFVPEHPAFMMATALYLVFGLALTAMCINIIQEKLTNTFREASAKLKVSFSKIMEQTAANQENGEELVIGDPIIEGPNKGKPTLEGPTIVTPDDEIKS